MALKTTRQPTRDELDLASVLYALGDATRLEILKQLALQGEIACGAFILDRPKSSLSHHFRVLRESGVVGTRSEGTSLVNWIRRDDLEARFPGLLDSVLAQLAPRKRRVGAR